MLVPCLYSIMSQLFHRSKSRNPACRIDTCQSQKESQIWSLFISRRTQWVFELFENRQIAAIEDLQFGSHQWIHGFFGIAFCLFSREVFDLETNPIPIFASSFQYLSNEPIRFFTSTNSTADIRQNMILSHLFDLLEKKFPLEKFWIFFPSNIFI